MTANQQKQKVVGIITEPTREYERRCVDHRLWRSCSGLRSWADSVRKDISDVTRLKIAGNPRSIY